MKKKSTFFVFAINVLILAFVILTQSIERLPKDFALDQWLLRSDSVLGEQSFGQNEALVLQVVDGDTIRLSSGEAVRYIGIDTPETNSPKKKNECFSKEAKEMNRKLVEGKIVRLEKDVSETDKYGRLLRYVWIGETMINEQLVAEGFAVAITFPPDVKYQERFREAEREARASNIGLWASCP